MLIAGLTLLLAAGQASPAATVNHPAIAEMSGIVKSRRYPDTYWVHNDSGDEARIFAIRGDGRVWSAAWRNRREDAGEVATPPDYEGIRVRQATNSDWEDIATDGQRLFLCDVGNNGNARRDLGVYAVMEPNPVEVDSVRSLAWYPVAYEDQREFPPKVRHYDCEAVFFSAGKLYFLTKHRDPSGRLPETGTNLYRMDTWRTDRPNVLRKIDSATDLGGWVTGADLSPDGRTLAVLTHFPVASVWLFTKPASGDRWLQGRARQIRLGQVDQAEAVCWDGPRTLLVTNEQRRVFRVAVP